MAANQNVTQLTQQTGTANATSLFYAVINGASDTGLPLSVLVNNLGLTGTPTTPTAAVGTNTTQIASCAFTISQINSSLASYAPLASPTFTGTATLPSVAISGGSINGTTIGASTPSTGAFTTLSSTGLATLSSVSTSSATINGGAINGTSVGATTPSTGSFTNLTASGTLTGFPGRFLGVQTFTASGTYTPTAGTNKIIVIVQAGGGGGGGTVATSTGQCAVGSGGGAGAYAMALITSGFSGATVTVGANGTGTAGGNGTAGSASSFGTFVTCPGGNGGVVGQAVSGATLGSGITSGTVGPTLSGATKINTVAGDIGASGLVIGVSPGLFNSGHGGSTPMGTGGSNIGPGTAANGNPGFGNGSGGGGAAAAASQAATTGGNGTPGIVIVFEYS